MMTKHINPVRVCRVAGAVAMIASALPFLVCFYRYATIKVNHIAQEEWTYIDTRLSALRFVALFGLGLGMVLLFCARLLRKRQKEAHLTSDAFR